MINVLDQILRTPKPMDLANWWKAVPIAQTAHPLVEDERNYLEFFASGEVNEVLRVRGIANQGNLTSHEREQAAELFKDAPDPLARFANRESRRRIVSHYVRIHPATIQYELELYRLSRDVNPITFLAERIHQVVTGEEAFTGAQASRLGAAAELLVPIVLGKVLRAARVQGPARSAARPLTDPIYDLPPEGGGTYINGRWYTEHALERMAPKTPQVLAELRARAIARLQRLGINEGSPAYDACLKAALKEVKPRGIPPSIVEAELAAPGTTNVRVITAKNKTVVVTIIPR